MIRSGRAGEAAPPRRTGRVPPGLHLIGDDGVLADPGFERRARSALEAADDRLALHLRGPGTSGRRLHDLASALRPVAARAGAALLVNDRVDVALTADAHGVQLPERSLPVAEARRLLGPDRWIGASVHGPDGAAAAEGADFLVVGTIFATSSHPGRPGAGPALLSRVRERVGTPLVAIGGIRPDRVREVVRAGATGVAVLSGVWGAADPPSAVAGYLEALADAGEPEDVPLRAEGSERPEEEP